MKHVENIRIYGILFVTVLLIMVSGCKTESDVEDDAPSVFTVIKAAGLNYMNDGNPKHTLDIYYPSERSENKVLFFVPGGAWRQGDKDKYPEMAQMLSRNFGLAVVVINYRLSNDTDGSAVHPDHINDVASAFAWVINNISRYNGNSTRVYLFGQSAGAHLVSLLATDARYLNSAGFGLANIRAVIAMSGAYDLYNFAAFPHNPLSLTAEEVLMYKAIFLDAFGSWDRSVLDSASPASYMNVSQPPFLIIHTEVDMPGFVSDGNSFYNQIAALSGTDVTLRGLLQSDYSTETWSKATQLAAEEPLLAEYIGHYAEVVAINENDKNKVPSNWIISFINSH